MISGKCKLHTTSGVVQIVSKFCNNKHLAMLDGATYDHALY